MNSILEPLTPTAPKAVNTRSLDPVDAHNISVLFNAVVCYETDARRAMTERMALVSSVGTAPWTPQHDRAHANLTYQLQRAEKAGREAAEQLLGMYGIYLPSMTTDPWKDNTEVRSGAAALRLDWLAKRALGQL